MRKPGRLARRLIVSVGLFGLMFIPWPARPAGLVWSASGPSPYLLPWEGGKKFPVSQTQGGTHQGAMLHAIDFAVYRGERLLASRAGKVIFREDRYTACGGPDLATRGNYVVIDHGDQTSALYLHLERVDVAVGQTVQQGDPIGTSGVTGWTGCAAHLHFQIQQNWGVWFSRSLPVTFNDPDIRAKDPNGVVKYNVWYESGNRASGATAGPRAADAVAAPVVAAAPAPATPARYSVHTTATIRRQASTESGRVGLIYPGQAFEIIEVVSGQAVVAGETRWVKIRDHGQEGFLYAGLVAGLSGVTSPPATAEAPPAPAAPTAPPPVATRSDLQPGEWVVRTPANVRAEPSTAAARVGSLATGDTVSIQGVVGGEEIGGESRWATIDHAGQTAYVYLGVLVTGPRPASDGSPEIASAGHSPADPAPVISIRARPTTASDRVGNFQDRRTVLVLEIVEGEAVEADDPRWARVTVVGLEGYVYAPLIE